MYMHTWFSDKLYCIKCLVGDRKIPPTGGHIYQYSHASKYHQVTWIDGWLWECGNHYGVCRLVYQLVAILIIGLIKYLDYLEWDSCIWVFFYRWICINIQWKLHQSSSLWLSDITKTKQYFMKNIGSSIRKEMKSPGWS